MSALDGHVRCAVADGVAWLTLDRPARHNSLVPDLLAALRDAAQDLAARDDLSAVVLAAAGRSFSTGGDIQAFHDSADVGAYADDLVGRLNAAILALIDLPVPLIGRVQGPVTGGALGPVLACDLVVAAPEAYFAPYYVDVGFAPDGGWTALLPDRIGRARAREIQLLNRHVGAEEAAALGLVTAVTDDLDGRIEGWLATLRGKLPGSVAATRARLCPPDLRAAWVAGLEDERRAFVAQVTTAEARQGMARFLAGTGRAHA